MCVQTLDENDTLKTDLKRVTDSGGESISSCLKQNE